jgi:hypothetical protein
MTTLRERFDYRVSPEPNTGCWLWMGGTNVWGYGIISLGRKSEGAASAHRVSYKLHKGDPGKLHVLHRCDNRLCVNPDHLFLGTCKDNMQDKVAKGRQQDQKGEKGNNAVLCEADVADIRTKRLCGAEFARLYRVSPATVCDIQQRRTWTHV